MRNTERPYHEFLALTGQRIVEYLSSCSEEHFFCSTVEMDRGRLIRKYPPVCWQARYDDVLGKVVQDKPPTYYFVVDVDLDGQYLIRRADQAKNPVYYIQPIP